ncbi:hypothetical protein ACVC7V_20515 [Hydrogenophaga sp. A37]|uniref:hypothetical protein n=1 Tax=Hydrogenophaga sp. A37 TaxID=1945864 RepID=UPI000987B6D0|nr:hypothetical protein [Hydrogenophaga sp. A37]OOG80145.1 hypothetical protein B0E41_21420 [Hydrogenophaga sp. A37]
MNTPVKLPSLRKNATLDDCPRFATRTETIERLEGDLDSLVVGVLDDLSYEIIKAYRYSPPKGFLEWIGTSATNGIRRLVRVVYSSDEPIWMLSQELGINNQLDVIRFLASCWLLPQMEHRFGPVPETVCTVLFDLIASTKRRSPEPARNCDAF